MDCIIEDRRPTVTSSSTPLSTTTTTATTTTTNVNDEVGREDVSVPVHLDTHLARHQQTHTTELHRAQTTTTHHATSTTTNPVTAVVATATVVSSAGSTNDTTNPAGEGTPSVATCGIMHVTSEDEGAVDVSARTIVLHALQVYRGTPYRDNEKRAYVHLSAGSTHVVSWPVQAGVTMELTLARFWSTLDDPLCSLTLHFRGVVPSPDRVLLTGGCRVSPIIRVSNTLSTNVVEINPVPKLDRWISAIKPMAPGKITSMGERDVLLSDGPGITPDTPLYQLILEYEIDMNDAAEITPTWPGLQGCLYESDFLSQFFLIFDSKRKLLGSGDAWPSAVKIGKGRHVVRLQIKHPAVTTLENLTDLPMLLERPLKSSITLTTHTMQTAAMAGNGKSRSRLLTPGELSVS